MLKQAAKADRAVAVAVQELAAAVVAAAPLLAADVLAVAVLALAAVAAEDREPEVAARAEAQRSTGLAQAPKVDLARPVAVTGEVR